MNIIKKIFENDKREGIFMIKVLKTRINWLKLYILYILIFQVNNIQCILNTLIDIHLGVYFYHAVFLYKSCKFIKINWDWYHYLFLILKIISKN